MKRWWGAQRWSFLIVYNPYFPVLPRPLFVLSNYWTNFALCCQSWDSCENCNVKSNQTKPIKIHCTLVEPKKFLGFKTPEEKETKPLTWFNWDQFQSICHIEKWRRWKKSSAFWKTWKNGIKIHGGNFWSCLIAVVAVVVFRWSPATGGVKEIHSAWHSSPQSSISIFTSACHFPRHLQNTETLRFTSSTSTSAARTEPSWLALFCRFCLAKMEFSLSGNGSRAESRRWQTNPMRRL